MNIAQDKLSILHSQIQEIHSQYLKIVAHPCSYMPGRVSPGYTSTRPSEEADRLREGMLTVQASQAGQGWPKVRLWPGGCKMLWTDSTFKTVALHPYFGCVVV